MDYESVEPSIEAMTVIALRDAVSDMREHGRVVQGFLARMPDGKVMLVGCEDSFMESIAKKMALTLMIRSLFKAQGVTHYAYAAEIWIDDFQPAATERAAMRNLGVHDPAEGRGRAEGLLIIVGDATKTVHQVYRTHRKHDGSFEDFLTDPVAQSSFVGEEWFFNLLMPTPHPRMFEWLRELRERVNQKPH